TRATDWTLLRVVGQLLSTIIDRELKLTNETRRTELAEAASLRDVLTGLWNRRAWETFLAREDARCRRYGNPACVLSIDLDGLKQANDTQGHAAGDELLQRAAKALSAGLREQDIVARVGGDEFAILLVECLEAPGRAIEARLRQQLAAAKVEASIGLAPREPQSDLLRALSRADELMYREKRARKG
ncbi:MAG TPA: GGDEF domain-containing protein, partial [Archangium sp.]